MFLTETPFQRFGKSLARLPINKVDLQLIQSTGSHTYGVHEGEPEFSSKNSGEQNVLHIFLLLIDELKCILAKMVAAEEAKRAAPLWVLVPQSRPVVEQFL
jgi:hypothetical protein